MNFLNRIEHSNRRLNGFKSLLNKQERVAYIRYFYVEDDICLFFYRWGKLIRTRPTFKKENSLLQRLQEVIDRIRP